MGSKNAAVTVRLPSEVKQRLRARARRERRSLSAQIAHELETALAGEAPESTRQGGRFVGLFEGARVPREDEFRQVRALLWGALPRGLRSR